jgi:hypothetical protein
MTGTWNLSISTPIGKQAVTLAITDHDGVLAGTASSDAETVPLRDLTLSGDRITWTQSITRPIRLNLAFDLTLEGDTLTGVSKAGRLPKSKVSGSRAS